MESFNSLFEAQLLLEDWRLEYNHYRPHQSLNYMTPAQYAHRCRTNNQPELAVPTGPPPRPFRSPARSALTADPKR